VNGSPAFAFLWPLLFFGFGFGFSLALAFELALNMSAYE
jgi:hypothetical protein